MKFEVLKRSHLKKYIIIGVVVILIISAVILNFTRAKYRVTESIPLVNGTINYDLADLNAVAVYIEDGDDYSKSDTIPESGYTFNEENSYCTVNGEEDTSITVSYDADIQSLSVSPLTTQGTKCYLYFDQVKTLNNAILADNTVNEGTPDFSQVATTDEGVYKTEDNQGTSYYFRGAVTNNYVYFAGYYWRIIRINGDGSIRVIYNGISINQTGESTQIGTSVFNESYDRSYYVGYTYAKNMQRPNVQNSGTASTIKGVLDNWYQTNIAGKGLDDKVVSIAGFCNDRNTASGDTWSAMGSFDYAAYERLRTNKTPTLECSDTNDIYTTKVGLITADEVSMAGGVSRINNKSYYLYTKQDYWTLSPFSFSSVGNIYMFAAGSTGSLDFWDVEGASGVRPVINLSADVTISSGDGTMNNPYVVN